VKDSGVRGLMADKITAYIVLHDVLVTMAHLIAPFTPFMAEMVYRNLVVGHLDGARESVHLCDFPSVDETKINRKLENDMERVLEIVSLGRAARNVSQLKIRQPLEEMIVVGGEPPVERADGTRARRAEYQKDGP